MPFEYKIDVLKELKNKGYNTNRLRTEALFGQSSIKKMRFEQPLSWENLEMLCKLLECDIGDIIEYVPDETTDELAKRKREKYKTKKTGVDSGKE